jgi:hypothetical protein
LYEVLKKNSDLMIIKYGVFMIFIKKMIVLLLLLVLLCINQKGFAADVTIGFITGNMNYKINKTSEATISLPVKLSNNINKEINVDIEVTGAKSQLEDFGTGKHYIISGGETSVIGYEKTKVTLNFPIGVTSKTAILKFVNNPTIDLDRIIKVSLTNASSGVRISPSDSLTIKLIDDQRLEKIDVKNPGHGLAALKGDGVTNDTDNLQAIFKYIKDNGSSHVVYFPAGTYVVNQLQPTWGLSLVGAAINQTILKKIDALTIGSVTITKADPAVVTLPSGHGLKNGTTVFLTDITAPGGWMDLLLQAYLVRNLSGNTCNLEYTGTLPQSKTLVKTGSFTTNLSAPCTMKLQYADHHTFNSTTYAGSNDSAPLVFRDMTFDGNSVGTGPWKYYEAEHSYSIFTGAKGTGYIKTVVENVHFKDLVAAGIHPYSKSDYNIYKITMNNGNTGGVCAISGTDVKVKAVNIIGSNDRPGEAPEFHSENAFNVNIFVRDLNITGNLLLGTQANSTVDVANTTVGSGLFLYAKDSEQHYENVVSDSLYSSAGGFIQQSHAWADNGSITFDNCDFYANGQGAPAGIVLSAGPQVGFSFNSKATNGTVTFKNSSSSFAPNNG